MRIRHADVIPFSTALSRAIENARRAWSSRDGVLLRLVDESGRVGVGEASPLPDYSRDTVAACAVALRSLRFLDEYALDPSKAVAPQIAAWSAAIDGELPAARFALETALLDLVAQETQKPVWALLSAERGAFTDFVPLCTLLTARSATESSDEAMKAIERGVTTVKLKVGKSAQRQQELALVDAVRHAIGSGARIRLDANQSLHADTLVPELASFAVYDPELIEEPSTLEGLTTLERSPIAVGLDESLQSSTTVQALKRVVEQPWCTAVVLKPTALGGVSRCLELARWAAGYNLQITVSHTFEGIVGHACAAHVALAIASRSCASGLDYHAGLEQWPQMPKDLVGNDAVLPSTRPGLGLDASEVVAVAR